MSYFFLHCQPSRRDAFLLMCMFENRITPSENIHTGQHYLSIGIGRSNSFLQAVSHSLSLYIVFFNFSTRRICLIFLSNHYLACCCRHAFFSLLWLLQLQCGVVVLSTFSNHPIFFVVFFVINNVSAKYRFFHW